MELTNDKLYDPYKIVTLHSIVKLFPRQMNNDIYNNLKENLKKKVLNKCNDSGMITEVIKITDYSNNIINSENYSGDAEYKITYQAKIFIPITGALLILRVSKIISNFSDYMIEAGNGIVTCILQVNKNLDVMQMENKQVYLHKHKKFLKEKEDYIKIVILNVRINPADNTIGVHGKVIDLALPDEIEQYYYSVDQYENETEESNNNLHFNEDDDYEGKEITNNNVSEI